jgi:hypothetical protein
MAPSGRNPHVHPGVGALPFHKTTLQRLEYIYHGKFTCFYKVVCTTMHCPAEKASRRDAPTQSTALPLPAIGTFRCARYVESSHRAPSARLPPRRSGWTSPTSATRLPSLDQTPSSAHQNAMPSPRSVKMGRPDLLCRLCLRQPSRAKILNLDHQILS